MRTFKDNQGRAYQHPPNRPNDREVMVTTRLEYIQEGLGGTSLEEANAANERAAEYQKKQKDKGQTK